jgi:D-serine deaminase-like pyridoxal phosphate-dependent protein
MTTRAHDIQAMLLELETPCLLLDRARLEKNAKRMKECCRALGVTLRPHLKTSKSLSVAAMATESAFGPITVSTLKEAEYFAAAGYRDILYAVAITPNKIGHAARIQSETGARILFVIDSVAGVDLLLIAAKSVGGNFEFLIEVDCGEHRSGVAPASGELVAIATAATQSPHLRLAGVMTHAGHSYELNDAAAIAALADVERRAAVDSAKILVEAGFQCPIVSVGSTPTVLFAENLSGITEARCGIYMFWDLAQLSRGVCRAEDIAVSVLASVIGHNRQGRSLILDAGALALSKDVGANRYLPDAKFGYLCDPVTMERLGELSVSAVHQEHGTVLLPNEKWFESLKIGSLVRIIPNHACLTCAAYDGYHVIDSGVLSEIWPRANGW